MTRALVAAIEDALAAGTGGLVVRPTVDGVQLSHSEYVDVDGNRFHLFDKPVRDLSSMFGSNGPRLLQFVATVDGRYCYRQIDARS